MTQLTQADTPSRNTRSRAWCFTLNNYSTQEFEDLKKSLPIDTMTQVVLGEEIGESGNPHIQGCVRFKNARSFSSLKKLIPRAHIEICQNWDASVNYCKKDNKFWTNTTERISRKEQYIKDTFTDVKWYPWQEEILEIITKKPNRRTINWYWETTGNVGKSFLCEYLFLTEKALIINGKSNDIFNAVKTYIEIHKDEPTLIIADIPRDNKEYITYGTLEKLKDGVFNSGKYEGGQIWLPPLHLICFANFEPNKTKISEDRWNIVEI